MTFRNKTAQIRLIILSAFAVAQTWIWEKRNVDTPNRMEIQLFFRSSRLRLVTKCVYIDVKQHNTTSPAQTSCLNMEIHSTDCCTIKCSAATWWIILLSLDGYVCARLPFPANKPKASYFYCVYMEITSLSCVYQQQNANAGESARLEKTSEQKENMSLTWPLNH